MMDNKNKKKGRGSWYNFKIGKTFSAKDIRRAQKAGFSSNQILKMGASAPFVKNSANKALSSFNSIYTTPKTGSMVRSGQVTETRAVGQNLLFPNQNPQKALTWNGVNADGRANALTINKPDGSAWGMLGPNQKSGEPFGQWATPLKIQDKLKSGPAPTPSGSPESPAAPVGGGGGTPEMPLGGGGPEEPRQGSSVPGVDSSINDGVTSFRRKKSRARTLGLTSKGTSQFKIGGQSTKSSGLNLGIG